MPKTITYQVPNCPSTYRVSLTMLRLSVAPASLIMLTSQELLLGLSPCLTMPHPHLLALSLALCVHLSSSESQQASLSAALSLLWPQLSGSGKSASISLCQVSATPPSFLGRASRTFCSPQASPQATICYSFGLSSKFRQLSLAPSCHTSETLSSTAQVPSLSVIGGHLISHRRTSFFPLKKASVTWWQVILQWSPWMESFWLSHKFSWSSEEWTLYWQLQYFFCAGISQLVGVRGSGWLCSFQEAGVTSGINQEHCLNSCKVYGWPCAKEADERDSYLFCPVLILDISVQSSPKLSKSVDFSA